jgi:hypothetical protein
VSTKCRKAPVAVESLLGRFVLKAIQEIWRVRQLTGLLYQNQASCQIVMQSLSFFGKTRHDVSQHQNRS